MNHTKHTNDRVNDILYRNVFGTERPTQEAKKMSKMAEKYDEILIQILSEMNAAQLLHIPGIYEIVSEEFNNEIIERFEAEQDETD